jgi:hypothetical protein
MEGSNFLHKLALLAATHHLVNLDWSAATNRTGVAKREIGIAVVPPSCTDIPTDSIVPQGIRATPCAGMAIVSPMQVVARTMEV